MSTPPAPPARVFATAAPLRFAECDPAGIAFYPRLVARLNDAVEAWFAEGLGLSWAALRARDGAGVPCRSLAVEFLAPGRHGEVLDIRLAVEAMGRSSLSLRFEGVLPDGRRMFTARKSVIWCRLDGPDAPAPLPIPDDMRARIAAYLAPAAPGLSATG
jgi:4-hydroxybenzoyl-CoA thioesterase